MYMIILLAVVGAVLQGVFIATEHNKKYVAGCGCFMSKETICPYNPIRASTSAGRMQRVIQKSV